MEIRINPLQVTHCTSIARPKENCYNLIYLSHANRKNRLQRSKSDNKAFLLIRLKKYLNPHKNSCSKVISILTTGNILHESSSAPRQHKSVQYKLTPRCFAYRHAATTFYQLQRGFGGRMQHTRIQGFLSVLFSPQLILQLTEGVQWFYC